MDQTDLGTAGPPTAPDAAGAGPQPDTPPPQSEHHDMLSQGLKQAKAQYDSVAKVHGLAMEFRTELDGLVAKGEAVTDDDVLDSMARLVGHGADPKQLGAIISGQGGQPMPAGGQGLAGWLQAQEQKFAQMEQQIEGPMAQARLGVLQAATHMLVAHHQAIKGASSAGQPDSGPTAGTAGPAAPGG